MPIENYAAAVSCIDLSGAEPHLKGVRCADCGQVFLLRPVACPRCYSRTEMREERLSEQGQLYSYTIVHRSVPGIRTPFVMAVVDLDGGPTIRGTLTEIAPEPSAITYGMKVKLVFRPEEQRDAAGRPYLSYAFIPAAAEGASR